MSFCVTFNNQIVDGYFRGNQSHVYLTYQLVFGDDWELLAGPDMAMSQVAVHTPTEGATFNFPMDIAFKTSNIHGWPRVVISVYRHDSFFQAERPVGYGCLMLPLSGQNCRKTLQLYVPKHTTTGWVGWLTERLSGVVPEYYSARFLGQGDGRANTRVEYTGEITINCTVLTSGINEAGFQTSPAPFSAAEDANTTVSHLKSSLYHSVTLMRTTPQRTPNSRHPRSVSPDRRTNPTDSASRTPAGSENSSSDFTEDSERRARRRASTNDPRWSRRPTMRNDPRYHDHLAVIKEAKEKVQHSPQGMPR